MRLMEDIEVIYELEKLLGVKSRQISLEEWEKRNTLHTKIYYVIVDSKIIKISVRAQYLQNSIEIVFEFLKKLRSLVELDLANSKLQQIPDSIITLTALTSLDLQHNQLEEFPRSITNLISLTKLNLSLNPLKEIPPAIKKLNSLTDLNLGHNRFGEFPKPIMKLKSLIKLDLRGNEIKIIPKLIIKLKSLQTLILYDNHLKEFPKQITKLTSLTKLDLARNELSVIPDAIIELFNLIELNLSINQFKEFSKPILKLTSLINLDLSSNELREIPEEDTNLVSLSVLELSGNQFKEFPEPITKLISLTRLDLARNKLSVIPESIANLILLTDLDLQENQIREIPEAITNLISLRNLDISQNQINSNILKLRQISKLPSLKELILTENPFPIPEEIFAGYYKHNCLQDLRNYFQDGDNHGWSENNELKIILIGNGGTGKTSLVNRLVHNKFDETYKSTHGIQLSQYKDLQPYTINIWDFAGQDIYHATHRLFMQTRALFLILWDNETENQEYSTVNEDGKKKNYKNYKLDYWLNYVKVLGKGSRALIIQSKQTKDGKINPSREPMNAYKDTWIDNLSIDSKEDIWIKNGYKKLVLAIEHAIVETDLLRKEQLPKNWVVGRNEFYELLDKGTKYISYGHFINKMCEGKESVNPDTVLHWLVDSGLVFYKEGLFNNQIIINQQWAINAVYTLFDRDNVYYDFLQNKKGFFTKSDLGKIWKENIEEERELFLSYMESCEICYRKDNGYIAPALLTEERPKILDSFWEGKESYFVKYEMLFFHYGTMQSFLVRLGNMQLDALLAVELWQYGILFKYNENTFALVEAKPDDRQIIVRVSGQDTKNLLDKIRNLIEEIQGKEGITESYSNDGIEYKDNKYKLQRVFTLNKDNIFDIVKRGAIEALNENSTLRKMADDTKAIRSNTEDLKESVKIIDKTTLDTLAGVEVILEALGSFKNEFSKFSQEFDKYKKEQPEILERLLDKFYQDNETDIKPKYTDKLLNGTFIFSKGEFKGISIPFKADVLEKNSLEMLACGLYMYEKIGHTNQDKAPINLEFCRIIENEFSMKLFNGFKNHLLEKLLTVREDHKSKEVRLMVNASKYKSFFTKLENENHRTFISIKGISDSEKKIKEIKDFASKIELEYPEQINKIDWEQKKFKNHSFMFGGIGYGLKLLEDSRLDKLEFMKEFKLFTSKKFEWKKISYFNLRQNLLKPDDTLFHFMFGDKTKNPTYVDLLFGEQNSLKSIYRNPSGHTETFLNSDPKTEYCMNIVLAFLKVWISVIRSS